MPTKKHKQIARTTGIYFSAVIVAIASIFWVNALILAWTSPTSLPPADNVAAPLNTGATGQSKAGGLILNTGGAATGLIVDKGNVGIGTPAPASKLEVAGTIHSTSGGVKFPDNTVQTTAVAGAGILEIKVRVIECYGNCYDEGTPNQICQSSYGVDWKALAVDCECMEVSGPNQTWNRTMDNNLDWCCDTPGEDMSIICYR